MKNKMLADHRYERRPRPALNVDINRTLAMFNVPADMLAGLERLKKRYGGFIKVSDNVRIHSVLTPIQHSPDPNTRAVQKRFPYSELTSRRIFPFATCPGEPAVRSPKTLHNWRFLCRSTNSEAVVSLLCSNPCDGVSAGPLALSSKYCDRVAQFTLRGWSSSQDGCGGAVSFEAVQRYPRQNARDVRVLALSQPSDHLASIAPPHVPFFNLSHAENIRTPRYKAYRAADGPSLYRDFSVSAIAEKRELDRARDTDTPIKAAAFNNNTKTLRELLAGTDLPLSDALGVASRYGRVEALDLLLQHKCSVNAIDSNGESALSNAVLSEDAVLMIRHLLTVDGIKVDLHRTTPESMKTSLHLACFKGLADIVRILLAAKANPDPPGYVYPKHCQLRNILQCMMSC